MSIDGKLCVVLGHTESKKQFTARVNQNNKAIKTKTVGYGANKTIDQAYKEIYKEGELLAKQYKCEFIPKKKDELARKSTRALNREKAGLTPGVVHIPEENPLITKFGNELAFKAMIRHAVKYHGLDKILLVLEHAMALVKDIRADRQKEINLISEANIKIARIIVETRAQGIHMTAPNKEIDAAIAWVIENDSKPKRQAKGEVNGNYELNGEKWNGFGHAPASFSKYLQQNENHSLDDLRVN